MTENLFRAQYQSEPRSWAFAEYPQLGDLLDHQAALQREQGRIGGLVFSDPNGQRIRSFRKAWAHACREAGVPGLLFHDLMRSTVRDLERAGVPRSVAMKLTGHKTEYVYARYAIVNERDLAEGGARLGQLHHRLAGSGR